MVFVVFGSCHDSSAVRKAFQVRVNVVGAVGDVVKVLLVLQLLLGVERNDGVCDAVADALGLGRLERLGVLRQHDGRSRPPLNPFIDTLLVISVGPR